MTTEESTTNGLPAGSLEEQVTWVASLIAQHEADVVALAAEAKKHVAEIDSLKATVRQLLPVGKHKFGNITVSITNPNRSFDADAFMKSYPVEVNPALYKAVIDSAALPPKLKDQFMVEGTGDPKVAIK
ncbi:hypothetical protein QEH68_06575 [Paenarthrobacter sp. OM7]|uniref:hypothetical protein n=1 Tax=Paenarthrobacter sp. OM7 TaxID=3041264 RepID=UPI0024691574|nr:hypothetical protein [Paenarthrobacter sp. OM7]WGM21833.1 hypothetical protein QEH68_06575 [Paenarthrobacter sp. OM7]